ncbi:type II secretion system F family protein [Nitratireductor sp. XY-223]|uniref:type II secretion system F family protein n=1 Tax=Nitratireductor sp. XY-223 TaxID=2561926 RepID=UPI0010AA8AB4|nr:type II secretion system F family protein [Nitratireductor sp. XY-223]
MFGIEMPVLLIILLVAIAAGGLAFTVLFPSIETQNKSDQRYKQVKRAETDIKAIKMARENINKEAKRRRSVQESLKDLEEKQKKKVNYSSPPLKIALYQTGWGINVAQFYIASLLCGLALAAAALIIGTPLFVVAGMAVVGGLGVPRWIVSFKRARRFKAFLDEFPNALDVIVRSIRSGLPINDALRMIATEAQEPLRTEFKRIVEAQQLGMTVPQACERLHENIPMPETSFFSIVITIQAQAGGNLSEALANLSRVIRDRKKMKAKVNALSMEAKASAVIIGSLPFFIMASVYMTSPGYIMPLFTDPRGHLILGASAIWMVMGVLVMRNMINFDI